MKARPDETLTIGAALPVLRCGRNCCTILSRPIDELLQFDRIGARQEPVIQRLVFGAWIMPPAGLCRVGSGSPESNGSARVFDAA